MTNDTIYGPYKVLVCPCVKKPELLLFDLGGVLIEVDTAALHEIGGKHKTDVELWETWLMYPKIAGTTMRVSTVETTIPPMMAIPIAVRALDASPRPSAIGMVPAIIARLVIKMGRSLVRPALRIASLMSRPPLIPSSA